MTPPAAPPPKPRWPGLLARFLALIAFIAAATWGVHEIREAFDFSLMPDNEQRVHKAITLGAAAYVLLLAIPFVPGAEIGLAMLTGFGPAIAPLVYGATILSMMLAYILGLILPIQMLERTFLALRMTRAAALVARIAPLSREARLELLLSGAPPRSVGLALRHRYIALALSVNIPGNSVIGGGGGIMLMAGLSGLFAPLPTLLTIAIAVSPVPLVVMALGGL